MLLPPVAHLRRQPGAADASEAERHVRRCAALGGSGTSGSASGGLGSSLALRLERRQRLAHLLGGRSQLRPLLPQLGEQRLEAEVGLGHAQPAHGLEQGVGRARLAHARCPRGPPSAGGRAARLRRAGSFAARRDAEGESTERFATAPTDSSSSRERLDSHLCAIS